MSTCDRWDLETLGCWSQHGIQLPHEAQPHQAFVFINAKLGGTWTWRQTCESGWRLHQTRVAGAWSQSISLPPNSLLESLEFKREREGIVARKRTPLSFLQHKSAEIE